MAGKSMLLILMGAWVVLLPALVVGLAAWRSARGHATRPMHVICAWCGAVMREGDPENVSHGICARCEEDAEV